MGDYVMDKAGNYGEVRMVNGIKPDRTGNVVLGNIGGSNSEPMVLFIVEVEE